MNPWKAEPGRPAPAVARRCILVVEDELLIRLMLSEELRDAGHYVVEACSADEALVALGMIEPDLIITDVRMPGSMDGMGLLAAIRETYPAMPVIIASGHLSETHALVQGATQFVRKPYTMELIVSTAQNALDLQ